MSEDEERLYVYVAARFDDRLRAQEIANLLSLEGAVITSAWLDDNGPEAKGHGNRRDWALKDLGDVAMADALVLYNPSEALGLGKGGRHVETGYALAMGKPILVWGIKENIFHNLDQVYQAFDPVTAMATLRLAVADAKERLWRRARESDPTPRLRITVGKKRIFT